MGTFVYIFDIAIFVAFVLGIMVFLRWKYERDLAPSKDFPNGRMVCEFWKENGDRYKETCKILDSGWEIEPPKEHGIPRYFFIKSAVGRTMYPEQPFLPFKYCQIKTNIVSWYEGNPEPIDPKRKEGLLDSTTLGNLKDQDTLALLNAVNEEMAEQQKQFMNAMMNMIEKKYVYAGFIICGILSIAAAALAYMAYRGIAQL